VTQKAKRVPPKPHAAWMPTPYSKADVYAIQALMTGTANEDQQKRALRWIIESAAGTYEMSFRPESSRDTDFAEGRRFVGNQLVKMTKINATLLQE
jgi:hypothetical protein